MPESRPESLLEYYYALLELLIEHKKIPVTERLLYRSNAVEIFSQANHVLYEQLEITWKEATNEFRHAIECHALHRHKISFAPTVSTHRNPKDNATIEKQRCTRCDTFRLRPHKDGVPWFTRSGSDRYDHSDAYKINGKRSEPSDKEYQYLFAAIEMVEDFTRLIGKTRGVKLPPPPQ